MKGFNTILVRYGEIALKSKEIRTRMEGRLIRNLKAQLKLAGLARFSVRREWGRIFVEVGEGEDVGSYVRVLTKVFGVVSVSPSIRVSLKLSEVRKAVVEVAEELLNPGDSFEVRVHRANKKYPLTSKELEKLLGADVLSRVPGLRVDLEHPDRSIYVEVRDDASYIYTDVFEGPDGLPYGVEGKVVALVSGGVDSAIATWMMMKRGCTVVSIHYSLSPYYGDDARERARSVLSWLRQWVPEKKWITYNIPLGMIHEKIDINARYRCLLCKFLMYRIAEEVARREGAKALVTGEAVGQVASQTLDNLYFLSTKARFPVFRPLIGFDKEEIVVLGHRLGVGEIASKKVLACTLNPAAQGRRAETHASEKVFDIIMNAIKSSEFKSVEGVVDFALRNAVKSVL